MSMHQQGYVHGERSKANTFVDKKKIFLNDIIYLVWEGV